MKLSEAIKEQRNRKRYIKKAYLNFVSNNTSLSSVEIAKQFKERVRMLPYTRRLNVTHINIKFSNQKLSEILENTEDKYFVIYNLPPLTITEENISILNCIKSNEPIRIINKDKILPILLNNINKINREVLFKNFMSKILYNDIERAIEVLTQSKYNDMSWIYIDILNSIDKYAKKYQKPLPSTANIKALIDKIDPTSCKAYLNLIVKMLKTEEEIHTLYNKVATVSFEDAVKIIIPYPNIILKIAQKLKSIKKLIYIYESLMNTDVLSHPDLDSLLSCILQLNTIIILSNKKNIPTFKKKYIDYIKIINEYTKIVNLNHSKNPTNIDGYHRWLKNYVTLRIIKRAYKDGKITDIDVLSTLVNIIENTANHFHKKVESICRDLQTLEELQLLDILKEELTTTITSPPLPTGARTSEQIETVNEAVFNHHKPRQFVQLSLGI